MPDWLSNHSFRVQVARGSARPFSFPAALNDRLSLEMLVTQLAATSSVPVRNGQTPSRCRVEMPLGGSHHNALNQWWEEILDSSRPLSRATVEFRCEDGAGWRLINAWPCRRGLNLLSMSASAKEPTEYYELVFDSLQPLESSPATNTEKKPQDSDAKPWWEQATSSRFADRYKRLLKEGHGAQRHEGQIQEKQVIQRLNNIDPETGTTRDAFTGKKHRCGRYSTKVTSEHAFVRAEVHIRTSSIYRQNIRYSEKNNRASFDVRIPLQQIYGAGYQSHTLGFSKDANGSIRRADFTHGNMAAIFKKDPTRGRWKLLTMYPEPLAGN